MTVRGGSESSSKRTSIGSDTFQLGLVDVTDLNELSEVCYRQKNNEQRVQIESATERGVRKSQSTKVILFRGVPSGTNPHVMIYIPQSEISSSDDGVV